jgi:anti-sigma regulatory factor (Ser/Thr protein kinase)
MGARESIAGRLDCRFAGNRAVSDAANAARNFAVELGLARSNVSRLCVIIEELVANLYEHGGLTGSDAIDLSLFNAPEGISIVLSDPGRPFDPRTATPSKPRPARGGGAGINIVCAWTRFVDYVVQPGQNRLELLMPIRRN